MKDHLEHVELQRALLQCAGSVPPCESVSLWVVQAIRPAWGGHRTDCLLFGLCAAHQARWHDLLAGLGYSEGFIVEWSGLGVLLDELDTVGWLDYARIGMNGLPGAVESA